MDIRVLLQAGGEVSIIYPAPKSKRADETEEQWLQRVFAKSTPPGIQHRDIDHSNLPQSREDRDCWEFDDNDRKVKVNQAKKQAKDQAKAGKEAAKQSAKDKLRVLGLSDEEIGSL